MRRTTACPLDPPDSDHKSGHRQTVMSALPPKGHTPRARIERPGAALTYVNTQVALFGELKVATKHAGDCK
jgi:hypothetical protein